MLNKENIIFEPAGTPNQNWIKEAYRILKNTGGIYLICDW